MEHRVLSREQSTALKGFAIAIVILCHVGNHYTRAFTPLGGIGVALFLALSGYGLECSYEAHGLTDFWKKRLISVFLPYLIVEAVTIPLRDDFHLGEFTLDITLLNPQHPLGWYMNYLLLWYVTFWIIKKIPVTEKKVLFIVATLCYAVFFFFTNSLRFEQSFAFVAGIYLYRFISTEHNSAKRFGKIWGGIAICMITLAAKQLPMIRQSVYSSYELELLDLVLKTVAAWVIIEFCVNYYRSGRKLIFYYIGIVSYELYLVHGYALGLWNTALSNTVIVGLFMAITVIGTILLYLLDIRLKKIFAGLRRKQ